MNYVLLIKTALAAIKTVESLMPDSSGKDKFDAMVAIVEEVLGDVSTLLPGLQKLATTAVTALRAAGVFKPKAA